MLEKMATADLGEGSDAMNGCLAGDDGGENRVRRHGKKRGEGTVAVALGFAGRWRRKGKRDHGQQERGREGQRQQQWWPVEARMLAGNESGIFSPFFGGFWPAKVK